MPLPPVEDAPNSMSRRHYLVERNRLRVKAYEPTRREFDEESLKLAKQCAERRATMLNSWKSSVPLHADGTRPLPGAARRQREKDAHALNLTAPPVLDDDELHKRERKAQFRKDILQQRKDREEYLRNWRANEKAYDDALLATNTEFARKIQEQEREKAREIKDYMNRMRATNLQELEKKRERQRERDEADLAALRTAQETQRLKAEADERRAKDIKRLMQIENQENYSYSKKKQEEDKAREDAWISTMMAHDAALAERERQNQEQKRRQFKEDFNNTVEKQKEFRRLHNYDEPHETIRKRNEEAAAAAVRLRQEERLKNSQRQKQYREELMKQMREKYEWQLTHLDGI
uniref:Uncharacterized protein TCIL3000_11_11730 n=1 Tax=Trypanosoma congolense (strain IL3000) TaxID=1068625 RepID=G0V209_TRYCI|nr:unnamed protein product [Trypanosoma congolense IL3000]